jgi:hypothetical protein
VAASLTIAAIFEIEALLTSPVVPLTPIAACTGYFDAVAQTIAGGQVSTAALKGSTEEEQFEENAA